MLKRTKQTGFTLIEVLLALAIIAIALAALLKTSAENVSFTTRIKDKTISHWVAMQGVATVQLGLLPINSQEELTQVTRLLDQTWYWRVAVSDTPIAHMRQIRIRVSKQQTGPFTDDLYAFWYTS